MNNKGFTLIEILVVLGISVILAMGGLFSLSNLRKHQALRLAAEGMVAFLRDSQQRSIGQEDGVGWGVHFDNSASEGDSYWRFGGADPAMVSEKVSLATGVELETPSDNVFFAKVSGLPDSVVVVKIRLSSDPSAVRIITINAQGTIIQE